MQGGEEFYFVVQPLIAENLYDVFSPVFLAFERKILFNERPYVLFERLYYFGRRYSRASHVNCSVIAVGK